MQALAQSFGCARVVYNDAVAARRAAWLAGEEYPTSGALQKRLITEAKRTPERAWLANVQHSMLQQAVRDCDMAYKNFFDSLAGRRVGRRMGVPRFKSRRDKRQTIRFQANGFRILDNGRLRLGKIGDIKVAWSRNLPSVPKTVTVIKTADDRYFASFVVEVGDETADPVLDECGNEIEAGLDLGLSVFAVDDQGRRIENPRFLRQAERKLKRAQRQMSRKQKGSNNRAKARQRLARQHAKVADARSDWLHQETTRLVRENQAIYLEDLAVSGLARTRLAGSVHDASWGSFRKLLEEKCARAGRALVVVDRWFPSTKTCSACGHAKGAMPLDERVFRCEKCPLVLDRDVNAACNILAAGRAERLNACGPDVRPPTGAVGVEAGTQRSAAKAQ
ncbi:RNA-guided endonuclease InsQ/TnpB family protein [Saccharopolyspora elongata]|nr:transposase [Saccharopolyspora elongata]